MSPIAIRHHRFSIYVYAEAGGRHHVPHCHLRRRDGSAETVLSLPLLEVLVGPQPTPAEWEQLLAGLQEIIDLWAKLNEPS